MYYDTDKRNRHTASLYWVLETDEWYIHLFRDGLQTSSEKRDLITAHDKANAWVKAGRTWEEGQP